MLLSEPILIPVVPYNCTGLAGLQANENTFRSSSLPSLAVQVSDDLNSTMTDTRSRQHKNEILSLYLMMLNCLFKVYLYISKDLFQ